MIFLGGQQGQANSSGSSPSATSLSAASVEDPNALLIRHFDQAALRQSPQGARQRLAGQVQVACQVFLEDRKDKRRSFSGPLRREMPCHTPDGVAQDDVLEQADQVPHPSRHTL